MIRDTAGAAILFVLCSAAMLWSVITAPGQTIAMDTADPVLNAAILYWNATTTPLTAAWWNFPAFAPLNGVTAFTEHLLGLWPLASPVVWMTGNPLLAYNAVFFLSFPLSALAMFALARALTGSTLGGIVAGIAFAFSPYRAGQLSHVQMLAAYGMPVSLLGLHRFLAHGKRADLALFALGWLVTALTNSYMIVFFGVYLTCWALWFCTTRATVRRLPALAIVGVASALLLAPIVVTYAGVHRQFGFTRPLAEIMLYSADVTGLWSSSSHTPVSARWLALTRPEGAIFPGVMVVLLALVACTGVARQQAHDAAHHSRWLRLSALGTAVVFFAAAVVAAATDLRVEVAGVRLLSLRDVGKPLTFGLVALAVWFASTSRLRSLCGMRHPIVFYALMVPVMWVLSLGPGAQLNGATLISNLPYRWLLDVPGVDGLRVPARFWMLATLSLAALAGFGAARLARGRAGWMRTALVSAVVLAEGWATVTAVPVSLHPQVRPRDPDANVLELPFAESPMDTSAAMLGAVMGGYRTLNGRSGYEPPHLFPLRLGLKLGESSLVTELRRQMPIHVSVYTDERDGWHSRLLESQPDAELVARSRDRALYKLAKLDASAAPTRGRAVPFAVHSASCEDSPAQYVADGSLATGWHCGPARPGQSIVVKLSRITEVSTIGLALGAFAPDSPRFLQVDASIDGARWDTVWSNLTVTAALRAAFDDPRRLEALVPFPAVRAQYVRLTQTGDESVSHWSIAELTVYSN